MVHYKIVYKMKHNPPLLITTFQAPKLNYDNIQQQRLLTVVKRHKAVRKMCFAENDIRNDI